jgi:ketosteroid isomerase-like protein
MSEQENVQQIRRLYEAFGRGDLATIFGMLDADVDWYDPGPPAVTHAGRYRGARDVERFFQRIGESLDIESFQPADFIGSGDRVVVIGTLRARVKQTGRSYDNEWVMIWTLREGRITKWQVYEDTARELAAHAELAGVA